MATENIYKRITDLTEKTNSADSDLLMVGHEGTAEFRRIKWSNVLNNIKAKLNTWLFDGLNTTSKTLVGAVNEVQNQGNILATNLSNPNLLINGDFQVWQRGTSFDITNNSSHLEQYTADRWWTFYEDKSFTVRKGENGGIAVSQPQGMLQSLEKPLEVGETYTLSAKVDDEIITTTLIGGAPLDNGLFDYFKWGEFDAIQIRGASTEKTIYWVKLEKGSIATPFVPRLYAEELAMCQRYYQNRVCIGSPVYYYATDKHWIVGVQFDQMRIPPTLKHVSCGYYNSSGIWRVVEGASSVDTTKTSYIMFHTNPISEGPRELLEGLLVDIRLDAEIY